MKSTDKQIKTTGNKTKRLKLHKAQSSEYQKEQNRLKFLAARAKRMEQLK